MNKPPYAARLDFFTSPPHPCGYLDGNSATTMFADPRVELDAETYTWLSARGFRRSGRHVYRPHCAACTACIAVRVPVAEFQPARRQRRTLARNDDLSVHRREAGFDPEHFLLYQRYLQARHADSQMEAGSADAYLSFLTAPWCPTSFYEYRAAGELLAVAVVDELGDGLSSVYTFFAPEAGARSLGRFAVLKQIELARERGLPWLYLGYWIERCRKMSYKSEYAPLEFFYRGRWRRDPPAGVS